VQADNDNRSDYERERDLTRSIAQFQTFMVGKGSSIRLFFKQQKNFNQQKKNETFFSFAT
jgi:hypothetical protein